jgi:hypothetical protein
MLLMRTAAYITRASGRGFGPGNRDFFWALLNGIEPKKIEKLNKKKPE